VFRRYLVAALTVAVLASAPAPAAAAPDFGYPWPDHSVIPVFFVPRDWSTESPEVRSEVASLQTALADIRSFFGQENNGSTFTLNPLEVVQAFGTKEQYHIVWNGRNIYEDGVEFDGNMEHEVVSELHARGFPTPPAQNESGYSVLIFVKGAGGWAGGREFGGADGGWAILGDWAIDSINGELDETAYWWSGRRRQIGAAAHELGHTFDLPHPDAYGAPFESSIMGTWWHYPESGLNDWERDHLAVTKRLFFEETLGPTPKLRYKGPTIATAGALITLKAKLSGPASVALADRPIVFGLDGQTWTATTNANGAAVVSVTAPPPGSHAVSITFDGDTGYGPASTTATLAVN
jgi:hypothetical protein